MTAAPPYSPRLLLAITLSHAAAYRLGQPHVGTEHLLLGMLEVEESSAHRMLTSVGVKPRALVSELVSDGHGGHDHTGTQEERRLTPEAEYALSIAIREANFWESDKVETLHLLLALLRDESTPIARLLSGFGVEHQLLFDMAAYDRVGLRF